MPNLQKVTQGSRRGPLKAGDWNSFIEAAADYFARKYSGKGGGERDSDGRQFITIQNISGSDVQQFGILEINDTVIQPSRNEMEFLERVRLSGGVPGAYPNRMVVVQAPIKQGDSGRAVIGGVTACRINVIDAAHEYAAPAGSTQRLESSDSGPATIIWKEDGTGDVWAIIRLGSFAKSDQAAADEIPVQIGTWYLDARLLNVSTPLYALRTGAGQPFSFTRKYLAWGVNDDPMPVDTWITCRPCLVTTPFPGGPPAAPSFSYTDDATILDTIYDSIITDLHVEWCNQGGYPSINTPFGVKAYNETTATSDGSPVAQSSAGIGTDEVWHCSVGEFGLVCNAGDKVTVQAKALGGLSGSDMAGVVIQVTFSGVRYPTGLAQERAWKALAYPMAARRMVVHMENVLASQTITAKLKYRIPPASADVSLTVAAATGIVDCAGTYDPTGPQKFAGGRYFLYSDGTDYWIAAQETGTPTNGWKLSGLLTFIGTYAGQGTQAGSSVTVAWEDDV